MIMNLLSWIAENKEWLFDGLGVTVIALLINLILDKKSNYQINFKFIINLIAGIIAGSIYDYHNNPNKDIRLSIANYLSAIVAVFILIIVISVLLKTLVKHSKTRTAVKKLNDDDVQFVLQCQKTNKYFELSLTNYAEFEHKWGNILYIKMGSRAIINEKYRIFVEPYALRLINKRLNAGDKQ